MDRRILEMIGAFVLGGGVVAAGYELAAPSGSKRGGTEEPDLASAAEDAGPDSGAQGYGEAATDDDGGDAEGEATDGAPDAADPYVQVDEDGHYTAFPKIFDADAAMSQADEAKYPQHAIVTSLAVVVRTRADVESPYAGILRAGTRLRVAGERTFGGNCSKGWYAVYPTGWICKDAGFKVAEEPPDDGVVSVPRPKLDAALPYTYLRIKDEMTPMFHRLPSFEEQDRADAAGRQWYGKHKREPMPTHPEKRPKEVPAVVKEYLNAGYYVTRAGEEMKSQRRFVRTIRGAYARKYQLNEKEGSDFRGVVLGGEHKLPLYFIRRELELDKREAEGSDVLLPSGVTPERRSLHPFIRKVQIGNKAYYEDAEHRLVRAYAVGKARKLKRPPGIGSDEHWVHVDLSEQVLVAYRGSTPVFTTLVSTGKEPGMTPTGVFRVQSKHVATSMRDQPVEDEAYSIEDVPWTQYFSGSVALHGAFWHGGFGLVRSHGCVNLSPSDARWLFGFMSPAVPTGWHSVYAEADDVGQASAVVVTE